MWFSLALQFKNINFVPIFTKTSQLVTIEKERGMSHEKERHCFLD